MVTWTSKELVSASVPHPHESLLATSKKTTMTRHSLLALKQTLHKGQIT